MIIHNNYKNFNTLSNLLNNSSFNSIPAVFQKHYSDIVFAFDYSKITCDRCGANDWSFHACYFKFVHFFGVKFRIKIYRVICSRCHKTHSIFIDDIIPFLSFRFSDLKNALSGVYDYISKPDISSYYCKLKQFDCFSYESICRFFSRNLSFIFVST